MAIERERKFLVVEILLPELLNPRSVVTGYYTQGSPGIRIQIVTSPKGKKAKMCFKSGVGLERHEFEYEVPLADACQMLEHAPAVLCKTRAEIDGWEVDCIQVGGTILWVAEYEEAEGKPTYESLLRDGLIPTWVGLEVTDDVSYTNQALAFKYGTVR